MKWKKRVFDGNILYDLEDKSGRIWVRLRQWHLGWGLWDWSSGSLNERRIDTYTDVRLAMRQGLALFSGAKSAKGFQCLTNSNLSDLAGFMA